MKSDYILSFLDSLLLKEELNDDAKRHIRCVIAIIKLDAEGYILANYEEARARRNIPFSDMEKMTDTQLQVLNDYAWYLVRQTNAISRYRGCRDAKKIEEVKA